MRKSVIMFVVVLTAIVTQSVSAFFQNPCCCCFSGIRERSLEFHIGYRRDTIHWKFRDPSLNFFQSMIPLAVALESEKICNGGTGTAPVDPAVSRFINEANEDYVAVGVEGGLLANQLSCIDAYREKWKDLRMLNIGGEGRILTCDDFYLRVSGNYGYVCDGKFKPEGGYAGDFFHCEERFSECGCAPAPRKRVKGHAWDISGAIGYQMIFCDCDFKFTPLLGFAYHKIDLCTDRCKVVNGFNEVVGELEFETIEGEGFSKWASRTDFDSYFTGPYLGFDWSYQCGCKARLYGNFEYHWALYRGHSNTKSHIFIEFEEEIDGPTPIGSFQRPQRNFFFDEFTEYFCEHCADFKQRACGRGLIWSIGAEYNFCECWFAGLAFHWTDWRTFKNGWVRAKSFTNCFIEFIEEFGPESTQRQFFAEEEADFASLFCKDARMTNVHWNSYRIELTLSRCF